MIKKRTIEVEVEEMESMTCDKCNEEYSAGEQWGEVQEFTHIDFVGGYDSIFGDGIRVKCDICQHCLKEIIEKIMRTKDVH